MTILEWQVHHGQEHDDGQYLGVLEHEFTFAVRFESLDQVNGELAHRIFHLGDYSYNFV